MDKEKSEKLYSIISLFAIIDIAAAGATVLFTILVRVPLWYLGVILVRNMVIGVGIAAAGVAVVALIMSKKGKESLSKDEKTMFIIALLTLMFMGACAGMFGNLLYFTSETVGNVDHIITHHDIDDPLMPLAISGMPFAVLELCTSIAGLALSALGAITSILNIVNIKGGSQTSTRAGAQTAARANTPPPSAAAGRSNFCAGCGAALDATSKFCQKCGKGV